MTDRIIAVYDEHGRRLLTLPQLAERLGITHDTARQRHSRGKLPPAGRLDARTPLWHDPKETSMDTQTLADEVTTTLGDSADDFDVAAIVEEIGDTYGRDNIRTVDDVPSDEYWTIVRKHERSA